MNVVRSTRNFQRSDIKFIFSVSISILFLCFLPACSLEASIFGNNAIHSEVLQNKATDKEVVSMSQQGVVTAAGFRVQSSVSYYKGPSEVRTEHGYKVRTSVQANLFKE